MEDGVGARELLGRQVQCKSRSLRDEREDAQYAEALGANAWVFSCHSLAIDRSPHYNAAYYADVLCHEQRTHYCLVHAAWLLLLFPAGASWGYRRLGFQRQACFRYLTPIASVIV